MADVSAELEAETNGLNKTQSELLNGDGEANGEANGENGEAEPMEQTALELEESKNGEIEPTEHNGDEGEESNDDEKPQEAEEEEEPVPQKSIRRSGRISTKTPEVTKSASKKKKTEGEDDIEMELDETQPTPKRRTSSRAKAPVPKLETPEVANVKRTPAPIRKRNAESDHRNVKAPKQKRLTGTPVIRLENQDSDDPFSFDQNADQHPEPLKNIQMEKGAFGEVKFTKTPTQSLTSKYANTEKTASERRGNLPITTEASRSQSAERKAETISALSPVVRRELNASIGGGSVTKNSTPRTKRGRSTSEKSSRASESAFDMDTTQEDHKPTPRSHKRKSTAAAVPPPPKKEEELAAPTLTPLQQLEADHPQSNAPLLNGARVFALWSQDFYPAIICGRDGLSRYRVLFVEDNLHRDIPPTGVIPIAHLHTGLKVVILNGENEPPVGEIIALPSVEDANKWSEGLFDVRREDSENIEQVSWQKIYLNKKQSAELLKHIKNKAVLVSEENIVVDEGKRRSSARNRSLNATDLEVKTTPSAKTPAKRQTPSSRSTKATPKVQSPEETIDEEIEPKNLSFGQSPVKEKFVTPKSKSKQKESAASEHASESANTTFESASESNAAKPTAIVTPNNKTMDTQASSLSTGQAPKNIFQNMKFVLTSANRQRVPDQPLFNKRECRLLIEERGGKVIDDFAKDYKEDELAFLIADTYYRTQKYLSALSLSIPCVDHKWISDCVRQIWKLA
uniref:BRCT domain-containing protein n=1 Tax=Acrobeloides nanus TaxID=290746 RepID=A0A914EL32_9BILA